MLKIIYVIKKLTRENLIIILKKLMMGLSRNNKNINVIYGNYIYSFTKILLIQNSHSLRKSQKLT